MSPGDNNDPAGWLEKTNVFDIKAVSDDDFANKVERHKPVLIRT